MKNSTKKNASQIFISIIVLSSIIFAAYSVNSTQKGNDDLIKVKKVTKAKITDDPITFSSELNNKYYYDNNNIYLNLDIKSFSRTEKFSERTPLNISVVIDKSGSMADKDKLTFVKKAVEHIIDELGNKDYISIVTYDDDIKVIYASSRIEDKSSLRRIVNLITSGGYTNLSGGMLNGYNQVESTYRKGYVNRVFLLSDGLANRGITDRSEISDIVRERSRRDGITISTFGVGNDFNENLMTDIADYGKGNYYYIKNSLDIPHILANELKGVRYLTGHDSKIRIKFPSEYLTVNKVFGYPYEILGDKIIIDLKDIFAEQNKTILIKFDIKKRLSGILNFQSDFEYLNPDNNLEKVSKSIINSLMPANSKSEFEKGFALSVQQNIVVFEANEMMELALKEADKGNYDIARQKIKEGKDYITTQKVNVKPSAEIEKQEKTMVDYEKQLDSAEQKSEEDRKEMQKAGKYENYNTRKKNN